VQGFLFFSPLIKIYTLDNVALATTLGRKLVIGQALEDG
jgi:hypothetical protein